MFSAWILMNAKTQDRAAKAPSAPTSWAGTSASAPLVLKVMLTVPKDVEIQMSALVPLVDVMHFAQICQELSDAPVHQVFKEIPWLLVMVSSFKTDITFFY
jgi:hypothetical protein